MTRLPTATAILLLSSLPAFADLIEADSTITGATVFPQGASVVRTLDFSAQAGQHSIVIDDLPMQFDPSTLRVTGSGDVAFRIVSVDHRITRLPPQDPMLSPEYRAISDEIDALQDQVEDVMFERRQIMTRIEVADGRLRMVEALMTREPQDMVDDVDRGGDPADWAATIEVLAQQMDIALMARLAAQEDMRPLDAQIDALREEIADKQRELLAVQLPVLERSVATVEIAADAPVSGSLDLTYRVHQAGWEPVYDLRLEQGADAVLDVERHARIWQATGEAWQDVAVTLSTARPSGRMSAPELGEQVAVLWSGQTIGLVDDRVQTRVEQALEVEEQWAPAWTTELDVAEPPVIAGMVGAQIETRGQTVIFDLPTLTDVDGDGTVRQAAIDNDRLTVVPSARSAPRLDPHAYLYAGLENTFDGPILPGRASVYVDGAFVGEADLPMVAAGAEVTLPFGVIDGITMSSDVVDRESGDYGLLSTTNTRLEAYRLNAVSVLPYAIELTIYDRAPVSEDEDLEIEVSSDIAPTVQDVDGNRGVVAWTFDLAAGEARAIEFGYEMWWPGDEQLILN